MKNVNDLVKLMYERDTETFAQENANLKKLTAEGLYPSHFKMPLVVQYELTANCNLNCKHCYNASKPTKEKDAMTPEKWKEFSRYLVSKGGVFQCILSGGEPLLLKNDLFEIMDILHDDGTYFHIISNGLLLDKEIAFKLNKYNYKWIQISIDSSQADIHDNFRGRRGTWQKAIEAVINLVNEGIPVAIAHTTTKNTIDDIEPMCKLAIQLGVSTIIFGEISGSGRAYDNLNLLLDYNEKNRLQNNINDCIQKYGDRISIHRTAGIKAMLSRFSGTPNTGIIIRPNGDMRLDCMMPFVLGNILKDDFYEIWNKKCDSAWDNPLVKEFIDSYDPYEDKNDFIKNYKQPDIKI